MVKPNMESKKVRGKVEVAIWMVLLLCMTLILGAVSKLFYYMFLAGWNSL